MGWTNYIDDAVRGFGSVADDIAASNAARDLAMGIADDARVAARNVYRNDVAKGLTKELSSKHAMDIMSDGIEQADDFYKNFVAKNGMTPEDASNVLYRMGRGAAHTGNFARDNMGNVINVGMTGMMFAPMATQMLPRSEEEQMYG
jgi:hypothetical protein